MNYNELLDIKKTIEGYSEDKQLEILKIIKEHEVPFTENQNGIFLNLSNLNSVIISKLSDYITYIKKQENFIKIIEQQKNEYHQMIQNANVEQSEVNIQTTQSTTTSSK